MRDRPAHTWGRLVGTSWEWATETHVLWVTRLKLLWHLFIRSSPRTKTQSCQGPWPVILPHSVGCQVGTHYGAVNGVQVVGDRLASP